MLHILVIEAEGTEAVQAAIAALAGRLHGTLPAATVPTPRASIAPPSDDSVKYRLAAKQRMETAPPAKTRRIAPRPRMDDPEEDEEAKPVRRPGDTLINAVHAAVREAPRTQTEIYDALCRGGYTTTSGSLQQMLSMLRKANKIYKDEDLKWQVAVGH